jgi:hypothetical protein
MCWFPPEMEKHTTEQTKKFACRNTRPHSDKQKTKAAPTENINIRFLSKNL